MAKAPALHFMPYDLAELDGIPELVRGLKAQHGPLYGLVNNAALGTDGALALQHAQFGYREAGCASIPSRRLSSANMPCAA